ncbi:hypothetical protein BGW39_004897 [Mortierella sp. 14UC]|nr:hypothetical protein BGW39_004897 [Mortierella sp. 14UC]
MTDPSVPGSNRASADASPRIRDMMRTFMGIPLSKSKATSLSLKSLPVSQKSRRSSIISQASTTPSNRDSLKPPNTLHDKPLSKVPKEDRPLANHPLKNVLDSVIKTRLPVVRDRIEKTDQLVYCNSLILRGYLASTTAITAEGATDDAFRSLKCATLDKAELDWLAETERNPMWRDHMQWLPARMVHEFVQESNKYSTEIAEIVTLGPVLGREHFRKLLLSLIEEVDKSRILNVESLQGLVQLVQSSSPGFLNSDDFIKILSLLRTRLRGTHLQSTEHPYHLTLAVSRVLDVMVEHEVKDLDRVIEHEPLCGVLSGLKDSADPYLMYQACYAFQALQYIPDNETPLQAILRHSTGVVDGVVKLSDMFKLDLGALLEGLGKLQEAVGGTTDDATSAYKGVCSLFESGRGVLDSLKEGLGSGQKRPWYPALRAACALAQAGQLKDLKQLIYDAPCRRDPLFQWGICQLLGELADDPLWAIESRQQAVGLLGNLNKNDKDWARDESVHMWMLTIIAKLVANPDYAVSANARELLEGLENTHNDSTQHPYPLRARLPVPASSPVLAKVQHIPFVEYDLFKFRIQRLEEATQPVYIPPMAKANLQAQDDELFILMDKVQEFLDSERQVMVILGDSGAGKSTFNKHLESELLRSYSNGGRIPLFINLPAIDRPDKELISEHLKTHNFSEAQIQELKQHREFIVVCDGYDESQLTANLHTSNSFNRPGQWRVKLIISCRTQYLGQDYRGRFVPQGGSQYNRPALNLFQEAVIAPFSKEQIRDYVEQYVPLEPRTWTTQDYMDKLTTIPNLMDLVKNPLLLTLALEALPDVIEGKKDISAITISRVQLYDIFVDHWINVNKRRLEGNILSAHDRDILEQLLNAGFTFMSIDYSIRLAFAIFERQNGNPVVQYVHIKDEHSWKADFFGPESKVRLLRDSSPLSRAGNLYRFIHRSMLEYFFSRTIFDPCKYGDLEDFTVQPGSESVIVEQLDANSPLFKRSLLTEPSIIQFLCERANQSSSFQKQLLAIVHQSKVDASVATAATNAITILVRAGVRFNGADLRGIRIPGADLSGGQFDSVQLQGANLRGVSFSRSWLRKADFGGAQMEGARFGELPYLQMTDTSTNIDLSDPRLEVPPSHQFSVFPSRPTVEGSLQETKKGWYEDGM